MLKKFIAPVVLGGTLLVAVGGTASAATPAPAARHAAHHAGHHAGKGALHGWLKANRKAIRTQAVDISATTIGITPQVLVADLKSGESIAQVATANDVQPSAVVAALVSAADAKVGQAVTAGTLTSTQGQKIEAKLPAFVTKVVDKVR